MDKKRLKIALKVLGTVNKHFLDTKKFYRRYEGRAMSKGKDISGGDNFFTSLEAKTSTNKLAQKNIFYFVAFKLRDILFS